MNILIKSFLFIFCMAFVIHATAQKPTINILDSARKISIRGLSVVDDNIIWASGSSGSVARS
ncbi:MAG: oxidoreductase, partial [Panacibacter sp.]